MTARPGSLGNRLLAAVDPNALRELQPLLTEIRLDHGRVLFEAGAPIDYVYFPCDGMISLVSEMRDGSVAETATIGREGAAGIAWASGTRCAFNRAVVQIPGTARRIAAVPFYAMVERHDPLRQLLLRYTDALLAQTLQFVACNALHVAEARLCRFLLMAQDRAGTETLRLTQEFLAEMLGVQRTTVTLVARTLQQAGLIRYRRGTVVILDRTAVEETSCECYGIMRREFERLLPRTYA